MKNIPVITVSERSLAETYEQALIRLYNEGTRFKTQYDKPDHPLSLDCTMNMTIQEPESDPMIHQAFPGGIEDLKEYVMELKGLKIVTGFTISCLMIHTRNINARIIIEQVFRICDQ